MPVIPGVSFRGYGFSQPNVPNVPAVGPAQGIAEIGKALSGAAATLEAVQDQDARVYSAKATSEIRLAQLKAIQEAQFSGEPLAGLTGRVTAGIEDAYAKALEDAPNGMAGRYLDLAKTDLLGSLTLNAQSAEAEDGVSRRVAGLFDTIRNDATAAATDPTLFPQLWANGMAMIEATAMPFEAREKAKAQMREVARSAVAGMLERNPYAAEEQLRSGGWDKYLDPSDRTSLYNGAQAAIKSREAEARARAAEARAAQAEAAGVYLDGVDDYLAFRAAGNPPDAELEAKYSPEAIAALPIKGADKLAKKASDALTRGDVFLRLRNDPTPENMARIQDEANAAAADPENYSFNAETARMVSSYIGEFQAALDKTPGEIAWQSGRVQEAVKSGNGVSIVAASYAEQERLGVQPWKRAPLSEGYAAQVAEQIASLPPDQQAGAVQELAKSYGSYWPDVLAQIGDKLPGPLAVAAVMPSGRGATRVAETAGLKIDDLTAGLDKDANRSVEDAMADNERLVSLGRVLSSQVGGARTMAQYNDAVKRSALVLMREGKDPIEAVEQAALDVTADSNFIEAGASVVAVPSGENGDMIATGLDTIQNGIDVSALDLPPSVSGYTEDETRAAYASSIRRNGEWVADGKGRGLYLRVMGDLVTQGGEPVLFTWDDLKSAAMPQGGFMFEQGR